MADKLDKFKMENESCVKEIWQLKKVNVNIRKRAALAIKEKRRTGKTMQVIDW